MKKCNCCGVFIPSDEIHYDVVVWRMLGEYSSEECGIKLCCDCKDRLLGEEK